LCFLRVPFMSCSCAIGAFYGQGSTFANCLIFGVQLTPTSSASRIIRRSRNGAPPQYASMAVAASEAAGTGRAVFAQDFPLKLEGPCFPGPFLVPWLRHQDRTLLNLSSKNSAALPTSIATMTFIKRKIPRNLVWR
jgi:hypothetical protein